MRMGPVDSEHRGAHERALARLAADAILLKMGETVEAIPTNFGGIAVASWRLGLKHKTGDYLYKHLKRLVEPDGIEPTTSCMPCKRSPN